MKALGADACIPFIVERLSCRRITGFLVCVSDERLREFARVCEMSLLQYMKFVRWPVMKDSSVRVGAYEVKRKMYKSCACSEMVGHSRRQMSGLVGSCRVK